MIHLKTIVEQAVSLFTTNGVKSISMDDLANSLTISKKTLYKQVYNKEKLLVEVIKCVVSDFGDQLNHLKEQGEDSFLVLKSVANFILIFSQENYQFVQDLKRSYPFVYEDFELKQREMVLNVLRPLYHELSNENRLKEEVSWATIYYIFLHACRLKGYKYLPKEEWNHQRLLVETIIEGIVIEK